MDVYTNQSEQKFKQSGLTVSVSNSLIDSAKSIDNLIDAGGNTGSTRMKGMASVAAALKTKSLAAEANSAGYDLLDGNLKGVGNTRIQATIGSSKSQSNSSSYTEANQGSSITTNNLALIASGAGTDSNIDINGSSLTVNKDALFQADNDLNINGVAQNSNTRSNNKSSSNAIGGYADSSGSGGITASAIRAKGYANSDSTTYSNSQVNVGGNTTLDIGNDVNIKNGVLNTDKIQGVIGGDMTIESLQDTATYDSDQKNMGFSADLDLAKGTGSSLSVNGGKTNVNADFKIVNEQSGIFSNEADLVAEGKGTFKGGVFVTSKEAQTNDKSNIVFKQGISSQDIKNTTSYEGEALSIGLSIGNTTGKPQATMNGIGYGTDSDSDSSTTRAGITGIAGNSSITTDSRDEYAGALENVFDEQRVNEELGAQTAGLGCYAAAIAGSAGATSSFDHIKTGFNNYGKPLSQQSSGDLIKNLKGLGFTDKGARNIQLAADILGTGGLGYSVAANKAVNTTSKYATSSKNVAKKTVSEVRYNNPQVYREQLAKEASIPKHIDFKNDVKTLAKLDSQELRTYFEINGYNTSKPASRGSGNAEVYNISNHETVKSVQYSPANPNSAHRGEYRKITYKDGRIFKFIDTSNHRLQDNKLAKNTTYFNDQGQRLIYNFNKRTWSVQ